MPERAAIYIRVSTKKQEKRDLSLPVQEANARKFAAEKGWTVADDHLYVDVISGAKDERPALDRLMAAVEATPREFDAVVTRRVDRIGRSARHNLELFERFDKARVVLWSYSDGRAHTDKFVRTIESAVAERERDTIRERVAEVSERRASQGRAHGGQRPYGYRFAGEGRLETVEEEAAIVRRVFAEYLAGRSLRSIARGLDAEGIQRPQGRWEASRIGELLDLSLYAGLREFRPLDEDGKRPRTGGALYESELIPAIIDRETWERTRRARSAKQGARARGRRPQGHHLFLHGLLRCAYHDERMRARTYAWKGDPTGGEAYVCNAVVDGRGPCPLGGPVKRALVDRRVLAYFEEVALDARATREQIEASVDERLTTVRNERRRAERRAADAARSLEVKRRQFRDDQIEPADYYAMRDELTAEREEAEATADRLTVEERQLVEGGPVRDAEERLARRLEELRRAVAGEVAGDTLAEVRAKLSDTFESFYVARRGVPPEPPEGPMPRVKTVSGEYYPELDDPFAAVDTSSLPEPNPESLAAAEAWHARRQLAEAFARADEGEERGTWLRADGYWIKPYIRPELIAGVSPEGGLELTDRVVFTPILAEE